MRKLPKPKPFRAAKEVKRLARLSLGAPPAEQVQPSKRRKLPKHKKKELDAELP